jgi:AraC family transcriptional regulator
MKDSVADGQSCCAESADAGATGIADRGWHLAGDASLPSSRQLQRVQSAIAFIENTIEGDLSLRRVAQHVHQSRFHFARAFKRATSFTLHAYVTERRLLRARELLLHGRYSLCEIALMCGFSSQAHLTTLYKQRFGCTPGQCREHMTTHSVFAVVLRQVE